MPDNKTSKDRYFNREISWLLFNQRVLEAAKNKKNPLLERLRFLSISASNLDEFYSVRVAGLKAAANRFPFRVNKCGDTAPQQLQNIYHLCKDIIKQQQILWHDLSGELQKEDVLFLTFDALGNKDIEILKRIFYEQVFPLLTPLVMSSHHAFPFISHEGMTIIADIIHIKQKNNLKVIIPIPPSLPRFYKVGADRNHYITIENLILGCMSILFPAYDLNRHSIFKILRDTDLEVEEEAEDLVSEFETALKKRRRGDVIHLKILENSDPALEKIIQKSLMLSCDEMIYIKYFIGLSDLSKMIPSNRTDLLFPEFSGRTPDYIKDYDGNIIQALEEKKEFLLHHPYDNFNIVIQFLEQAAQDPDVIAIKFTLYRTSDNSPIVAALIEAAENGKNITAVVELRARFDEAANIKQAKAMQKAGINVVFGFRQWKTHAKLAVVVKKYRNKLKIYSHIGTGNYHPLTAKIYTDLSYFTSSPLLGYDAMKIFNFMTGYVQPESLDKITISPTDLKAHLLSLIDQEANNAKNNLPASIIAKMNSLVDHDIIDALYKASNAGVQIKLNIRGICCLRPNVKDMSQNITVISVMGRFLEHSRVTIFGDGYPEGHENNKVFISSADWMPRNLERRIESFVPIENTDLKKQLIQKIIMPYFDNNIQSWKLDKNGEYHKLKQKKLKNLYDHFHTTR